MGFFVTQAWLSTKFNELNQKLFRNSLKDVKLQLNPNLTLGGQKAYGAFGFKGYVDRKGRVGNIEPGSTVIRLNNNPNINRSEKEWINTLVHEMIHAYVVTVLKIHRKANAHDGEFAKIANDFSKIGYNITEYGEEIADENQNNSSQIQITPKNDMEVILLCCKLEDEGGCVALICKDYKDNEYYTDLIQRKGLLSTSWQFFVVNQTYAKLFYDFSNEKKPLVADQTGETYGFFAYGGPQELYKTIYNTMYEYAKLKKYKKFPNYRTFWSAMQK